MERLPFSAFTYQTQHPSQHQHQQPLQPQPDHDIKVPTPQPDQRQDLDLIGSDSGRKHVHGGGRPKDFIWVYFDGDKDHASCRACGWQVDKPKAFRMRTHAISCTHLPEAERQKIIDRQSEKEIESEHRKLEKLEKLQLIQGSNGGGAAGAAGGSTMSTMGDTSMETNGSDILSGVSIGSRRDSITDREIKKRKVVELSRRTPNPVPAPRPAVRSPITAHVLDSTSGSPAPDVSIRLERLTERGFIHICDGATNSDGRCPDLLVPAFRLETGIYKITFSTGEYFAKRGIYSFYPFVEIPFEIKNAEDHYHIPLLLAPFAYSTYRGS